MLRKHQFNIHIQIKNVWIYKDSIHRLFHLTKCLSLSGVLDKGITDTDTDIKMSILEWRWTSTRLGFTEWNEMAPNRKRGGVFYKWYGKDNKLDSSKSRTSTHQRKGTNLLNEITRYSEKNLVACLSQCVLNRIEKCYVKRILNIQSWQAGITTFYS